MPDTKPYRHELRTVPEPQMETIIESQRRTGAGAWENVEDSLLRIKQTKLAHSSRTQSWGEHPDERVAMAMIEGHRRRAILGRDVSSRINPAIREGIARAEAEEIVWTPVLDMVAAMGHWYSYSLRDRVTPKEWAEKLVPWIETRTSEEDIFDLLRFWADEIWYTVAEHTPILTKNVIEKLLERPHTARDIAKNQNLGTEGRTLIRDWMANRLHEVDMSHEPYRKSAFHKARGVSGAYVEMAFKELLEKDWEPDQEFVDKLFSFARKEERVSNMADQRWAARSRALGMIMMLGERIKNEDILALGRVDDDGLPDIIERKLLERIEEAGQKSLKWQMGRQTKSDTRFREIVRDEGWKQPDLAEEALASKSVNTVAVLLDPEIDNRISERAFVKLLSWVVDGTQSGYGSNPWSELVRRAFTEDQLLRMYEVVHENNDRVRFLINHEAAGPRLWKKIAEDNSRPLVRTALAESGRARQVPEVRDILLSSNASDVMAKLAMDGNPGEARALIERLLEKDDVRAFDLLREAPPEAVSGMNPVLLQPWLTSSDRELRAQAIMVMGKLREETPETAKIEKVGRKRS